jgi:hypothetical protein
MKPGQETGSNSGKYLVAWENTINGTYQEETELGCEDESKVERFRNLRAAQTRKRGVSLSANGGSRSAKRCASTVGAVHHLTATS